MKKRNLGISLISLIITIIVIIILAAIVIFSGMGTPEKAQLSAVISDIDNVQTAVDQAYYGLYTEKSVEGEVWTKSQLYESVATGETERKNLAGTGIVEINTAGMVKMNLPQYEGRKWGVAVEDIDDTTKVGNVVLIPGFKSDNKIYSTLLDVQSGGRSGENDLKMNAELADNSAAKLLKVGDYVDYVPDAKTYTPNASILGATNSSLSTETAVWRVWSVNKATGEVIISPETSVNEFKVDVIPQGEKTPEIDKICNELYSNKALRLEAHLLTSKDIHKILNADVIYKTSKYAHFLASDGVEKGTKVMYKGEEYEVRTHEEFMSSNEKLFYEHIEGGEIETNSQGQTIRKVAAGKPIYETDKWLQPCEIGKYNTTIANFFQKKVSNKNLYEWLGELGCYARHSDYMHYMQQNMMCSFTNILVYFTSFDEPKKISHGNFNTLIFGKANYLESIKLDITVRPKVILNSSISINTADTTKNGKSQETAWQLQNS